jgi:predicted aspartyl protease
MTTSEIPLEVDKTVNCVQAVVEGTPLKMILKPDVDDVWLSASSAEALGITRPGVDVGVKEEVEMEDGQKLPARRVTLKSVQLGPFKAEDLECLVFLNGYETDPILGAGFLNQFAYRIDPEAGKLILTRADVKSSSKPSPVDGLDKKKTGRPKSAR